MNKVGAHEDRICKHLMERCQPWYRLNFEFLLHDMTSIYFEVFADNRTDVTTVGGRVKKMEDRFG